MCGGCYFGVKRFDLGAIIQFLLDRLIFSFDQIKEMGCKVSWGLAIKLAMMPELRLLSIANGNSSGGVEEKSLHFMGRQYQTMAYGHQTILAKAIARAELCRICLGRSLLDSHVLGLAHS